MTALAPSWLFVSTRCSGCQWWPCVCARERVERCGCGGVVIARENAGELEILAAVRLHQQEPLHVRWSARTFALDGSGPRSAPPLRDVSAGTTDSSAAAAEGVDNGPETVDERWGISTFSSRDEGLIVEGVKPTTRGVLR